MYTCHSRGAAPPPGRRRRPRARWGHTAARPRSPGGAGERPRGWPGCSPRHPFPWLGPGIGSQEVVTGLWPCRGRPEHQAGGVSCFPFHFRGSVGRCREARTHRVQGSAQGSLVRPCPIGQPGGTNGLRGYGHWVTGIIRAPHPTPAPQTVRGCSSGALPGSQAGRL